jgi:predicted O-methyltransferase YrrM
MSKIRTLQKVITTYGFYEVAKLLKNKFKGNSKPTLNYDGFRFLDSSTFLIKVLSIDKPLIEKYAKSVDTESAQILKPERQSFFEEVYDLDKELALILTVIIKTIKPKKILETGVAAGKSTALILQQLETNKFGELLSVDITEKVGELVPNNLKNRWTLRVLPKIKGKQAFKNLVLELQPFQIFLHDSDHSPAWQQFELEQVLRLHNPPQFLVIDDADPAVLRNLKEEFPNLQVFCIQEKRKIGAVCLP